MRIPHSAFRVPHSEAGFTLLELFLAMIVLLVILMVGVSLAAQASSAWHSVYNDTHAVHDARSGLAAVVEELRQSNPAVVTITPGANADTLVYQVPIGHSDTSIQWGAGGTDGWKVRVRVVNGELVREVLNAADVIQGQSQTLGTGVDSLHAGAKGFSVVAQADLYTIRVRTRAQTRGHTWRKETATTVCLRN